MKKVKVVLIGAGDRGTIYARLGKENCPELELVAVADPNPVRRNYIRDLFNLSDTDCYENWEELLSQPKLADAAIIATQDQLHFAPAMEAISKGYHLLLEKPAAPTPEECFQISEAAKAKGVEVVVCHVLRFTPFFRLLKQLIDEGRIGKVMNIDHVEGVGNIHHSHSFVRGNWRNSETSSPMILAKSCHDLDILQWLLNEKCTRVQSFGSLTYFCKDNMPEGAPEFCVQGCPAADDCPYNAETVYLKNRMFIHTATKKHSPTDEDIRKAITQTNYGRCVFQCDNNVVDKQVVNLEYESGAVVCFTMSAFNYGGRKLRIMGTKGEINAEMSDDYISLFDYQTREETQIKIADAVTDETIFGGHGGGDRGIIRSFCAYLSGTYQGNSITDIETSVGNHLTSFAAEQSRLDGTVINMNDYVESLRNNK